MEQGHGDAADRLTSEHGSVTAEFALALPGIALVLLFVIHLAVEGATRVALEEGARAAARELARGESAEVAEQTALSSTGDEAAVAISADGEYSHVALSRPVRILGLFEVEAEHSAEARARTEHLEGLGD